MKTINLIKNIDACSVTTVGRVKLEIFPTEKESYLEIDNEDPHFAISIEDDNEIKLYNNYDVTDSMTRTNSIKENDKNALSILANIALDVIDLVKGSNKDNNVLNAKLYINHINEISIKGESINLVLSKINLSCLNIECANVNVEGEQYISREFNIKTANLFADILFDANNNKISIDSSNARLNILSKPDFEGKLLVDANNIKYNDPENIIARLKNDQMGILKASINNGKISLNNE